MDKKKLLRLYSGFNILSDFGSGVVGRFKGYLPNFGTIILELGALTVIFANWHIDIPSWALLTFLVGKQYFWMVVYYFAGMILKKIGFLKAQNEFTIEHYEDFNPFNMEVTETLEVICKKLGVESKFDVYKNVRKKGS